MRRNNLILFIIPVTLLILFLIYHQNELFDIANGQRNRRKLFHWSETVNLDAKHEIVLPEYFALGQDIGNIPEIYLENFKVAQKVNKTCANFPEFHNLKVTNDVWQTQETSDGTFHLFNAFFDGRGAKNDGEGSIRILGMLNRFQPQLKTYCQIWIENGQQPLITPVVQYFYIWYKQWGGTTNDYYQPYLITCPWKSNDTNLRPYSVSLVEKPCDSATNNLRIIQRKPLETQKKKKKDFVVCVKGLNFPTEDNTLRLVEWIEVLKSLGAQKISFYEFSVHPNVRTLLKYYQEKNFVEIHPLTLVGQRSNLPLLQQIVLHKRIQERRLQEVIPYNDCFYRHFERYRFIVILDIDEVIIPKTGDWHQLINDLSKEIDSKDIDAFSARNVYFLDSYQHEHEWFNDIPQYLHMLQHVERVKNYTKPGYYIKCFHNTERVLALHNHLPMKCLNDKRCRSREIDLDLAHLQHYRTDCVRDIKNCNEMKNETVQDTRIWQFKNEIIGNVQRTLLDLGFIKRKVEFD